MSFWRMTRAVCGLGFGVAGVGCASPSATAPAPAPATGQVVGQPKVEHLPQPDYLPPEARALLSNRMKRHSEYMVLLTRSVVLLDHDTARVAASEIVNEPQLQKPSPDQPDVLNARLPPRFFILQDQLVEHAKELAAAAEARDDNQLARAYAGLSQTCVACHSAYLYNGPAQ